MYQLLIIELNVKAWINFNCQNEWKFAKLKRNFIFDMWSDEKNCKTFAYHPYRPGLSFLQIPEPTFQYLRPPTVPGIEPALLPYRQVYITQSL